MTTAARCCVLAAAATSQLRASVGTMMAVGAGLVTTRALINGDDRRRSMALSLAIVGGTALKSRPGGCIQRTFPIFPSLFVVFVVVVPLVVVRANYL